MKKLNQFLLSVPYLYCDYIIKPKCDKNMMFKIKESEYLKKLRKLLYIFKKLCIDIILYFFKLVINSAVEEHFCMFL